MSNERFVKEDLGNGYTAVHDCETRPASARSSEE